MASGAWGRLALRAGWGRPDLQFVHINENFWRRRSGCASADV